MLHRRHPISHPVPPSASRQHHLGTTGTTGIPIPPTSSRTSTPSRHASNPAHWELNGGAKRPLYDHELSRSGGSSRGNGTDVDWDIAESRKNFTNWVGMGLHNVRNGMEDALRMDRSLNLVWNDRELKTLIVKSTLINLLSLLLLSLSSLIFSPVLLQPASSDMQMRTKAIGMWYKILLSWPVFVVCFWVNANWGPDISKRAQILLHPTYRHQPSVWGTPSKSTQMAVGYTAKLFSSITRVLLISDFTLVSRLIGMIPLIGWLCAFAYMCIISSYYCFEWTFSTKNWSLDYRIKYLQARLAYMFGFGFPVTLMTSFGPPLVAVAIFALVYPFFVIQALQSRPPSRNATLLPLNPSSRSLTPSPGVKSPNALPADPFGESTYRDLESPSRRERGWELKLPIFWFANHALRGLKWLEDAAAKDRSNRKDSYGLESHGRMD
ncbi:etoposide-induced protein [Cryptococcus bacillisporus CA1873]|uniref:Etoposide-induced protein n=1 Tax=Cryptococcus bacillisporus CA1873 TaxID=1296111 RepID=A0ABR5BDI7_CRYGA|nr:etoposide-induced protein [Cryptococcus bacillisporus CA1873]|eukprot:KIR67231.1 etoposide-induced protein [Cryptococcus gattii CA1873]